MKYHAKYPCRHPKVCEYDVISTHRVFGRDPMLYFAQTNLMRKEIDEGKEDGEWLLHAQEPVKRPFSVEL